MRVGNAGFLGLVGTFAVTVARADPAPAPTGKIPVLEVGFAGGFSFESVPYNDTTTTENESGGIVGIDGRLHLDLGKALVDLHGLVNLAGGHPAWIGRAAVIFGRRTTMALTQATGVTPTNAAGQYTASFRHYEGRRVPVIYGVKLGVSKVSIDDTTYAVYQPTYDPAVRIAGSTMTSIEAGLGVLTGQFEAFAMLGYETESGSPGIRWGFKFAYPIGRFPLFVRLEGDHWLGGEVTNGAYDGARLGTMMIMSFGLGSSLGVGTD